jgi:GNAT superfamily N-acetyltransferase
MSIELAIPVQVRTSRQDDESFILSSWINSARGHGIAYGVGPQAYHAGHRRVAERLLAANGAIVACAPEDPDVIYAWACVDERTNVLHFIYVKRDLRRAGLARRLLDEAGLGDGELSTSHWTPSLRFLRRTVVYNPYCLLSEDA